MPEAPVESEEELEFEATPSLPPLKKGRVATSSKKGKKKMTVEEISHYYSSSSKEEHITLPSIGKQRKTMSTTTKPTIE